MTWWVGGRIGVGLYHSVITEKLTVMLQHYTYKTNNKNKKICIPTKSVILKINSGDKLEELVRRNKKRRRHHENVKLSYRMKI